MQRRERKAGPRDIQERAFAFAVQVVRLHRIVARGEESGRILVRQVLRSGTLIGANLEEANAGQSKADFIAKCSIALKEARETQYWLRLLVASDIATAAQITPVLAEATEIVAILTTIVKNARNEDRVQSPPKNGGSR
jgi:four helix bundle protein